MGATTAQIQALQVDKAATRAQPLHKEIDIASMREGARY